MIILKHILHIVCFCLCLAPFLQASGSIPDFQPIQDAYDTGLISKDERALLLVKAIFTPESLPNKYVVAGLSLSSRSSQDATAVLKEIRDDWGTFSPSTQASLQLLFGRSATSFTYDSPGGYFKLHYNTDIDSSDAVPADDLDSSGVPDFIEKCAAYCDTTLVVHLELGYTYPPSDGTAGGDDKYDIYFSATGYYGYTTPEGDGGNPWNDYVTYITLNSDFLDFEPNNDPEGDQFGAMKVTVAHEFHHAVQFSYDGGEPLWFMDLDATCFEDIVFDASDDNYNYLPTFFNSPEISLMNGSNHRYSTFIYGLFISQLFDTSLMRAAWEGSLYVPDVFTTLGDSLYANYGWTQDSAFAEFALWNYLTSIRDYGSHYEEGSAYPEISVGAVHTSYPVALQNSPGYPEGYAATYVEFIAPDNPKTLQFIFNGSDSRQWAAWLVKTVGLNNHEFERLPLEPVSQLYYGELLNFEQYDRVALIGVNLDEGSAGTPFSYSANAFDPYSVASEVISTDSVVYSGSPRLFEYRVENTSPLVDNFTISISDSKGWGTVQMINRTVQPGEDTVFTLEVTAPVGTPIDDTCHLHFKAVSWADPSVYDEQVVLATVVLQRGDMNFNGSVDISDLIYLVEYMFNSGPDPQPVEAADFNCSGGDDISDLVAMVTYMFQQGAPSPCNPL